MVVKLKSNVSTLESQVDSLKADLTEVRRSQSLSSADRHSDAGSERSYVPSHAADEPDKYDDHRLSFSYVYQRNKTRDWVPVVSVVNEADEKTRDSAASEPVFRSPEHLCHHCCTVAMSKEKSEKRVANGLSSASCGEGIATCNGETVSETADQLSSDTDVLNDTLSDLVGSNSDAGGDQVLSVKVSTTVRCRKHIEHSKSGELRQSDGSVNACETSKQSEGTINCSVHTEQSVAEQVNDRYTISIRVCHV